MSRRYNVVRFSILLVALSSLIGFPASGLEGTVLRDRQEAPERIIAIGDLHGDLDATRAALRLADLIDENDRWIGGTTVLVQTGDILDRGDQEEEVMALFENLILPADEAGGAVYLLNGNHELMNAYLDYRYLSTPALTDFEGLDRQTPPDSALAVEIGKLPPFQQHRARVFSPGGDGARFLAKKEIARIVGNTVFVHGGILPEHVDMGLPQMNAEARKWLLGELDSIPKWIRGDRSPVWTRLYSDAPDLAACDTLSSVLEALDVDRMVVGHSVQTTGITSYCGGRVWCIDVGIAASYQGFPEVLEIKGDAVRSIRPPRKLPAPVPSEHRQPSSRPGR